MQGTCNCSFLALLPGWKAVRVNQPAAHNEAYRDTGCIPRLPLTV